MISCSRPILCTAVLSLTLTAACGGQPNSRRQRNTTDAWPHSNLLFSASEGIHEQPVVGASKDEAQNFWVATREALYLLKPGEKTFRRYSASDGLHLASNPVSYCDKDLAGGDHACPIPGAASSLGITSLVGGGPDEVFVGYAGIDEGSGDWADPNRHSGKLDRVRLKEDGGLQVDRFDLVVNAHGGEYWHNRTVFRMLFDHDLHPHELYVGTNHGVDLLRPDAFRNAKPGEWFDTVAMEYMADHLHPRVCYHSVCDATGSNQRMGDWRGLALNERGELWAAGKWTAGAIRWDADLKNWFSRGGEAFSIAFGDPYPRAANAQGFVNEPVFRPPQEGDSVSLSAVAVAPDGRVWFASGPDSPGDVAYGVAVWDGHSFRTYDPLTDLGMGDRNVRDLVALDDGRIALASSSHGITLWNPATGARQTLAGTQWLPDDQVIRLELDRQFAPAALHVATKTGAAMLRQLP